MQSSEQLSNTLDADSHDLGVNSPISDADSRVSNSNSDDPSEQDDAYYDSSTTPQPNCDEERHPYTLFAVRPWSSHCFEYGGMIFVIARDEEECCDILHQRYGGHRSEIESRVRYADTLWLASSNMTSGIWQTILH